MSLFDLTKKVLETKDIPLSENPYCRAILDNLQNTFGLYDQKTIVNTSIVGEFYDKNPILHEYFKFLGKRVALPLKNLEEEFFYGLKSGQLSKSVPAKTLFYIKKAMDIYDTPNKVIQSLGGTFISNHSTEPLYKILEYFFDFEINLLTEDVRLVINKGYVELYVENIDAVCVGPLKLRDLINSPDLKGITYNKELGVSLFDKVSLRSMLYQIPLVKDDLDLRTYEGIPTNI